MNDDRSRPAHVAHQGTIISSRQRPEGEIVNAFDQIDKAGIAQKGKRGTVVSAIQGDDAVAAERLVPRERETSCGSTVAVVADLRAVDAAGDRRWGMVDRLLHAAAASLPDVYV